jgi:hypothetical protein
MSNSICAQLSVPDSNGLQNCLQWTYASNMSLLPSITYSDANDLLAAIAIVFAIVWGFKIVGRMIRSA